MLQKFYRSNNKPHAFEFRNLTLNSKIFIFSSIFTWKNIVRAASVSIIAMLIRKGLYYFFDIDIFVYFLVNNSLTSYIITFVYFSANFFTGLSAGEIFNYLCIKYIKENISFLGLPLGLELSKNKILLGDVSKTKIKEIEPQKNLNQDNIQAQGGSDTLKNIDILIKNQEKWIKDLEKLVLDIKGGSSETSTEIKLREYNKLIEKTLDLRLKFLNDSASLQVTKQNAIIFQKELTALDRDLGTYITEIETISVNDPNSQKKTFDAMNKYKSARTKTLNLLTEITRKDLKNLRNEEAQSMLKRLNRFDNAANSSQSELKKLQKELAQNIHK